MMDKLRAIVLELIRAKWVEKYELVDVLVREYGFSLVFVNKVTKNRFSPTLIPNELVKKLLNDKSIRARSRLEKEIETAFVKENISG